MKEVTINLWCDDLFGDHPGEKVAGVGEETVSVDGREYTLDACADCHERLETLRARWVEAGVLVPRKKAKPKQAEPSGSDDTPASWRTCQDCGHVTPSRSALGQHLKHKHNTLLTDYEWDYDPREARKAAA